MSKKVLVYGTFNKDVVLGGDRYIPYVLSDDVKVYTVDEFLKDENHYDNIVNYYNDSIRDYEDDVEFNTLDVDVKGEIIEKYYEGDDVAFCGYFNYKEGLEFYNEIKEFTERINNNIESGELVCVRNGQDEYGQFYGVYLDKDEIEDDEED